MTYVITVMGLGLMPYVSRYVRLVRYNQVYYQQVYWVIALYNSIITVKLPDIYKQLNSISIILRD